MVLLENRLDVTTLSLSIIALASSNEGTRGIAFTFARTVTLAFLAISFSDTVWTLTTIQGCQSALEGFNDILDNVEFAIGFICFFAERGVI